MSEQASFFLLSPLHTLALTDENEWLGRVVKNYAIPVQSYTPESNELEIPQLDIYDGILDLESLLQRVKSESIEVEIRGLLGWKRSTSTWDATAIRAPQITQVRLRQDKNHLDRLMGCTTTKRDILNWIGPRTLLYMIVGFLAADNLQASSVASQSSISEGSVEPPLNEAIAAGTGVVLPGPELLKMSGASDTSISTSGTVRLSGRRIFALEYRCLRRQIISRRNPVALAEQAIVGPRMFTSGVDASLEPMDQMSEVIFDDDSLFDEEGFEAKAFLLEEDPRNA